MMNDRYFALDWRKLGFFIGRNLNNEEARQDFEEELVDGGIITDILDLRTEGETLIISGGDAHVTEERILDCGGSESAENLGANRCGDGRNSDGIE